MNFVPSHFQQSVYDFVLNPLMGNAIVNAVAGSGKSSTLEATVKQLPASKAARTTVVAFNKAIANELQARLGSSPATASTCHSLGMKQLGAGLRCRPKVEKNKYVYIAKDVTGIEDGSDDFWKVMSVAKAADFARTGLVNASNEEEYGDMVAHYELMEYDGMQDDLVTILSRGLDSMRKWIDFTDMLYAPVKLNLPPTTTYDFIFGDEAQDWSPLMRKLLTKYVDPNGGRFIAVGDPKQAIYGFAGAEVNSLEMLTSELAATQLPLSICYRCPRTGIELAKEIVPTIEAAPNAKEGEVRHESYETFVKNLVESNSPLIMCRTTAPLISTAFKLFAEGKKVKLQGKDVHTQLMALTRRISGKADWDKFPAKLDKYEEKELLKAGNKKASIAMISDKVDALRTLVEKSSDYGVHDIKSFQEWTGSMYADGVVDGVCNLTTIHKAKGLEAAHTALLHPELLPHPMAKASWAAEQEKHLKYIASTRHTDTHVILDK